LRATGVLEKRDGKWLLVQMHFSVGVQEQAVQY
jgi:SnoaL-like domain